MLDLGDHIEDILITLGKQYHLIRLLYGAPRPSSSTSRWTGRANLAMARHELRRIETRWTSESGKPGWRAPASVRMWTPELPCLMDSIGRR